MAINDILVELRFGSSTLSDATNPAPIISAKSSESTTMPKAILMLFFWFKSVNIYLL